MMKPGLYKHYSGDTYRVDAVVHDSTNGKSDRQFVIYYSLSKGEHHVREYYEFNQYVDPVTGMPVLVTHPGAVPRFAFVSELPDVAPQSVEPPKPVPLLLWCPECGERHIDEGEQATREHRTHACQKCGMLWAPAVVPTVGVWFLPGCGPTK